jgi:transposase-like protein
MTLALLGNTLLRTAITRNIVSFPAQVRPFLRRGSGDLQERMVQLFFVRGWPVRSICERYGVSKAMAHKLLAEWRIRAVESGQIQEIEAGTLDGLLREVSARESSAAIAPTALAVETPERRDFVFAAAVSAPPAALSAGSGV